MRRVLLSISAGGPDLQRLLGEQGWELVDAAPWDVALQSVDGDADLPTLAGLRSEASEGASVVAVLGEGVSAESALAAGADDFARAPVAALDIVARLGLRTSATGLRTLLESLPVGVLAHDGTRITYVNGAAVELLQRRAGEMLGTAALSLVSEPYRAQVEERLGDLATTGRTPVPLDIELDLPDGSTVDVRAVPLGRLRRPAGTTFVVLLEPIAERRAMERRLWLARSAMDRAADPAFWVDPSGVFVWVNEAACKSLGYDGEELVGMSVADIDPETSGEDWAENLATMRAKGSSRFESTHRCKDGSLFPVEVVGYRLEYEGEEYICAYARDLRERKRWESDLERAEWLASVGTLAAGVAHEINNPLSYVLTNLDLVGESLEGRNHPLAGAMAAARDGIQRIQRVTADLRALSRPTPDQARPTDLHAVLERAFDMVRNQLQHRASLSVEFGEIPSVLGSDQRLCQVFVNLLQNAAQAIPEEQEVGEIRIVTSVEGDYVAVEIRDDGEGMEPALAARVFDPFFTTKPIGTGTGLGLPLCRTIVEAHGGTIEIESQAGEWTTVRVRLPVSDREAVSDPSSPSWPIVDKRVDALRVLVVDDEPEIGRALRAGLKRHDVTVAQDAKDATARLASDAYDLILCDVIMPGGSGIDLYRATLEADPTVAGRFVFMTGGAFTPATRDALDATGRPRLEKPFTLSELRMFVSGWSDRVGRVGPGAAGPTGPR